jgi:hypothetical protein
MRALPLVAALLAVGCGGSAAHVATSRGQPSVTSNHQRAERSAAHLLSLARVPPNAVAVSTPPAHLAQPQSRPSVDSLVDRSRFWTVAMSFDDTLAWLQNHRPEGLHSTGRSSGSGPGYRTAGDMYDVDDVRGLTGQQLQIEVSTVNATTTGIRADGIAIWLDPRPVRDTAKGVRLRITIAGGCPAHRGRAIGVTNHDAALSRSLLPAGRPTAALVCRYNGGNDRPPFGLGTTQALDQTAAKRVADAARSVDLSHALGGTTSCPMDDGSVTVIVFAYPGRADVDLWFARTGCQQLSNGSIVTSAGAFGRALAHA